MTDAIRVFVGCAAGGEDAESCAVLAHTVLKHASRPVEFCWMNAADRSGWFGGWNMKGWATPFSGFRWAVPAVCGFQGRAIYMDSDVIVRADIAELWDQPMAEGVFALVRETEGKLRTCVMLMDCARSGAVVPPLETLKRSANPHALVMAKLKANRQVLARFAGQWNCIDLKRCGGIDDPDVKAIHYSSMPHQPHLSHARARLAAEGRSHWYDGETAPHWRPELQALFDRELAEALAEGPGLDRYDFGWRGGYGKKSFAGRAAKVVNAC